MRDSIEGLDNETVVLGIAFSIKGVDLDDFPCNFTLLGEDSLVLLKAFLLVADFIQFSQDLRPSIGQSLLIGISIIHFGIDLNDPLSVIPDPIIEPISVLNGRFIE